MRRSGDRPVTRDARVVQPGGQRRVGSLGIQVTRWFRSDQTSERISESDYMSSTGPPSPEAPADKTLPPPLLHNDILPSKQRVSVLRLLPALI